MAREREKRESKRERRERRERKEERESGRGVGRAGEAGGGAGGRWLDEEKTKRERGREREEQKTNPRSKREILLFCIIYYLCSTSVIFVCIDIFGANFWPFQNLAKKER